MSVTILEEGELRECVGIDAESLAAVEQAFTWLAQGAVAMPPIMHVEVRDGPGDVDIKSACVEGLDSFAVKIASGFFGNPDRGLPSSSAMMVLLSTRTGFCEAVMLDNGYLTDLRTGLAGAVAAKHLARERLATVGVIGTGIQARYQVECLRLVRDFSRLAVFGRDPARTRAYADEMRDRLGVEVDTLPGVREVVEASDLVVTTTPARDGLIERGWLHEGLHVTAMGSDLPGKRELGEGVLGAADRIVCDSRAQCTAMGEIQHLPGRELDSLAVTELGALTGGAAPGRESASEITVCDLTGTGVQDTAIAVAAYRRAIERGLGRPAAARRS